MALEDLDVLAEAGVWLVGENRAQDLEAKAERYPDFRWHFIGQLQSRKVKQIVPRVELIHSVASESALRQLERHAEPDFQILLEVNVAGEEGKAGIAPDGASALSGALAGEGRGADDDAAVRVRSGGQPAVFRAAEASSPTQHGLHAAEHGYVPGLRRCCSRGCNHCADRHYALHVG